LVQQKVIEQSEKIGRGGETLSFRKTEFIVKLLEES